MSSIDTLQLERLSVLPGRLRWQVSGLTDPRPHARSIEEELRRAAGIERATFNPLTDRVLVHFDAALAIDVIEARVRESLARVLARPRPDGAAAGASDARAADDAEPVGGHVFLAGAAIVAGIAATAGLGWAIAATAAGAVGTAVVMTKLEKAGGALAVLRERSPELAVLVEELAPLRRQFGVAIAYDVVGAVAGIGRLLLLGVGINSLGGGASIALLAGAAVGLTVVQFWSQYRGVTGMQSAGREVQHRLRVRLYDHIQRLQMAGVVESAPGHLASLVVQDVNTLEWTIEFSNRLVQTLIETVLLLVALFVVQSTLGLASLTVIVGLGYVSMRVFRHLRPRFRNVRAAEAELDGQVTAQLDGLPTIRAFNLEARERDALESSSRRYMETTLAEMPGVVGYPLLLDAAVTIGLIAGSVLARPTEHGDPGVALGDYFSGIMLAARLFNSTAKIGPLMNNIMKGVNAYARIRRTLEMPCEPEPEPGVATAGLGPVRGEIVYDHVTFSYPGGAKVLDDLTLRIEPGKTTAIVGLTGSGKSTLINLLLGFHRVDSGRILLDGKDLRTLRAAEYRAAIALVSQDIYLFDRSARDNIAIGRPGATTEEIIEAARAAQADEVIRALPHGYDTVLGKRGETLSGGQRQRIAIARAILRDAPILVLDEATSQLDNVTFERVQGALERLAHGRTVIAITHRMAAARRADHCYVIEAGRVVESGTHGELMHRAGIYARLWE